MEGRRLPITPVPREIPKPRCGGRWSEARYSSFIKSALRGATRRWAPKWDAKRAARVGRNQYRCSTCSKTVPNRNTHMDHKLPVVDVVQGFVGWDIYIERLFVERDGWRLLCKACHAEVTKMQREQRKLRRK